MQACELVAALYVGGWSAAQICDGPLRELMRRIGELWHDDESGIFVEHRATEMCLRVINHVYALVESADERPIAIGGALEDDPFQIPSLMAAFVLAAEGYESVNAGANTPLAALSAAIDRHAPELVWISVNGASLSRPMVREVSAFAAKLARNGIGLVVGGRRLACCVGDLPPSVQIASSMCELVAFAHGLRAAASCADRARASRRGATPAESLPRRRA